MAQMIWAVGDKVLYDDKGSSIVTSFEAEIVDIDGCNLRLKITKLWAAVYFHINMEVLTHISDYRLTLLEPARILVHINDYKPTDVETRPGLARETIDWSTHKAFLNESQ